MTRRLRTLRLAIVLGYLAVGLGVALHIFGIFTLVAIPATVLALGPIFDWVTDGRANRRMVASIQDSGRDALTSDQMDWSLNQGRVGTRPTVIDNDPNWGMLVEARDRVFNVPLTAVQVTNSSPEPDGTFKKVWLRVPSRGDRQGTRNCIMAGCGKDIAFPPRTAKEAIAWGFRFCEKHYQPKKAT